jgi:RNA polymerase sigma factor (sigma-70 family)
MKQPDRLGIIGAPLSALFSMIRSADSELADEAWGECYRQYHEKVWTRVFYVIRSIPWLKEPGEIAADVTGQVFLGLPDALRNYEEAGRAEAWLMRIALRTALRQKESLTGNWAGAATPKQASSTNAPRAAGRVNIDLDGVTGEIMSHFEEVENDERLELSRRLDAWRGDPDKQRWLEFIDFFLEGYSHDEIAERLEITPKTSRTWLWKIRRALAEPVGQRARS